MKQQEREKRNDMTDTLTPAETARKIALDAPAVAEFCRKWHIAEMSLFGSVLRDDFKADSDVDILVSFIEGATLGLLDKIAAREELEVMLGRNVGLATKSGLLHRTTLPSIRDSILAEAEIVYAHE